MFSSSFCFIHFIFLIFWIKLDTIKIEKKTPPYILYIFFWIQKTIPEILGTSSILKPLNFMFVSFWQFYWLALYSPYEFSRTKIEFKNEKLKNFSLNSLNSLKNITQNFNEWVYKKIFFRLNLQILFLEVGSFKRAFWKFQIFRILKQKTIHKE